MQVTGTSFRHVIGFHEAAGRVDGALRLQMRIITCYKVNYGTFSAMLGLMPQPQRTKVLAAYITAEASCLKAYIKNANISQISSLVVGTAAAPCLGPSHTVQGCMGCGCWAPGVDVHAIAAL